MHKYPAIHNAMWPGLVGKGGPGAEPPIDLETMLDHTAKAEVNGRKFGVSICSCSIRTSASTRPTTT
jgi:hypothetical protein